MDQLNRHSAPPLWQRLFSITLTCALVPAILCGLFLLLTSDATSFATLVYAPVTDTVENQLKVSVDAHGKRIDTRMERIGSSILQLQALAEEVLGSPEFYGAFEDEETDSDGESPEPTPDPLDAAGTTLDNPLYYSIGVGGALRKLIDDGGSAVYFAEHGGFSQLDMQRLYATAALDPLMIQPVEDDPLCLLSFIITSDNLLRIYPFRETAIWPADLIFAKPYSYWSAAKADENGLVWTQPYKSRFEDFWVVACLAQVEVGGSTSAVVGCEIPVNALPDELLSFTLGPGGMCWMSTDQQLDPETTSCTVIAAQTGAGDFLKLTPVSSANLPDDRKPTEKLISEADIYSRSPEQVVALMKQAAPIGSSAFPLDPARGQFLASVNIPSVGWKLSGIIENPAMAAVQAYQEDSNRGLERKLVLMGLLILLSIVLAFMVAFIAGRRASNILSSLRNLINSPTENKMSPTGMAELDSLADAIRRSAQSDDTGRGAGQSAAETDDAGTADQL